jgi:hypothetical protein
MARELSRGEIWHYRFAAPDKRRPVLILTRQEVIGLLHRRATPADYSYTPATAATRARNARSAASPSVASACRRA